MPITGAGYCPAGSAFAGFGSPEQVAATAIDIYRDLSTGRASDGRQINPLTRDYVLDDRGRAQGMTEAQQFVTLALSMDQGSSAVADLGNRLKTVKVITDAFQREVSDIVNDALADGVSRDLISVKAVNVVRDSKNRLVTMVRWVDMATGKEHPVEI